jgi:two-component system catabolic regulation response regulator CreB
MTNSRLTILVVEDEAAIAETILYALRTEGFNVEWKTTGTDALKFLEETSANLAVLDVGLPDMNGFDLCRAAQRKAQIPVIFLTARSSEVDRIVGLELGADDYLAKPFSPRELTARVRAILRRTNGRDEKPKSSTAWEHDSAGCRIAYRGHWLELTRNEYRLLAVLLSSPGRVFNREQIMEAAWEDPGAATDRTVDAHVKLVRAKLRQIAPESDPLMTHRGLGYSLREEA